MMKSSRCSTCLDVCIAANNDACSGRSTDDTGAEKTKLTATTGVQNPDQTGNHSSLLQVVMSAVHLRDHKGQ